MEATRQAAYATGQARAGWHTPNNFMQQTASSSGIAEGRTLQVAQGEGPLRLLLPIEVVPSIWHFVGRHGEAKAADQSPCVLAAPSMLQMLTEYALQKGSDRMMNSTVSIAARIAFQGLLPARQGQPAALSCARPIVSACKVRTSGATRVRLQGFRTERLATGRGSVAASTVANGLGRGSSLSSSQRTGRCGPDGASEFSCEDQPRWSGYWHMVLVP
jgi:hypothetical protein